MNHLSSEQIHVISLLTVADRRKHIGKLFDSRGIPFSFFDAIHGRNTFGQNQWPWFYDPAVAEKKGGATLSLGDLGCAASHLTLWEQLAASNHEAWVIFEDDIVLSPRVNLAALEEVVQANGAGGITLLNHVSIFGYRRGRIPLPLMGGEARFPIWGNMFAGAYVMGRDAAVKALDYLHKEKLWAAVDTWGSYKNNDWGFCHLAPLRVILPPPAWQSFTFTSAITQMGRELVLTDAINQSGKMRWQFPKGFLGALRFFIRGHLESFRRPKNIPSSGTDVL